MNRITLADATPRRLVFYLAMEEYVAGHREALLPAGSEGAFFLWRVAPTVIFGRHQVLETEVNLPYCRENGVQWYRRKSGGGCVYADPGNIMLSAIYPDTDVTATFQRYLSRLAGALQQAGVPAEATGRNDILVNGRKVSGNAFFRLPNGSIVHGTMLYDTDFEALQQAITPSQAKLGSKGVASVRQHVTNLRDLLPQGPLQQIEAFEDYLYEAFCAGEDEIVLNDKQIAEIEEIESGYLEPDFISGKSHGHPVFRQGKAEGAGEIGAEFDLENGRIVRCRLQGDFFPVSAQVNEQLSSRLHGVPFTREGVAAALEGISLDAWILHLSNEAFLNIIFNTETTENQ
ncbi:MAG: lipoyltransferase [Bacteroidales bacterium]|nr:lipoyltransferase [Bacteroidales bacterium]